MRTLVDIPDEDIERLRALISQMGGLAEHAITHRRGGYRDPESQAFIESWFSKLKQRCVWREEFETLEQARDVLTHGELALRLTIDDWQTASERNAP